MSKIPIKGIQLEGESGVYTFDAEAIAYENGKIENATNVKSALETLYDFMFTEPTITLPANTIYTSLGEEIILRFDVEVRGTPQVTVKQGTKVIYSQKVDSKAFEISAGKATALGETIYAITVSDNLGNNTTVNITNKTIQANIKISDIDGTNGTNQIEDQIISYSNADSIFFSLPADKGILFSAQGFTPTEIGLEYSFDNMEFFEYGEAPNSNSVFKIKDIELNSPNDGTILFRAYYKISESPDKIYTSSISIKYYLVEEGKIRIKVLNNINGFDSNQNFILQYKILDATNSSNYELNIKLYNNNDTITSIRDINKQNLKNNVIYTEYFGILQSGSYQIVLTINDNNEHIEYFTINQGESYITDGLLAYFTATDENTIQNSKWIPFEGSKKGDISIQLSTGYAIKDGDDTNPKSIHLQPNAIGKFSENFGTLLGYYDSSNIDPDTSKPSLNPLQEFSIELYCKATNIGELKAPILTSAKTNSDVQALTLYHNKAYLGLSGQNATSTFIDNNKWNHIVFVVSKKQEVDNTIRTEDKEYHDTVKIYLNGCVVACQKIQSLLTYDDNSIFNNLFILNGYLNNNIISESGNTFYSLIRLYNKGLHASDILLNYKQAINYNKNLFEEVQNLENNKSIAKIFFIKNKTALRNKSENDYISFSDLNQITKKKPDEEQPTGFFSKTSAVNCTAFLIQNDTIIKYPNMDVYLQGTSSLNYPIKNYQIKNYQPNSVGTSQNFLPPVEEINELGEGWGGINGDYIYTLKCDYMEQSHKNNTPTAQYYDDVLNAVGGEEDSWQSPAKQAGSEYRDSITGFPILVYYYDNDNPDEDLTQSEITNVLNIENLLVNKCFNTGSYMFNIDKEGRALGFEAYGAPNDSDSTYFNFPIKDYYITKVSNYEDNNIFSFTFENEEKPSENNNLYLFGFNNDTYNVEEIGKINIINEEKYQLSESSMIYDNINELFIKENDKFTPFCISEMEIGIQRPSNNCCISLEGTANSQDKAAATFYTVNEANKEREKLNETLSEKEQLKIFDNKFDYYELTLEPRYSYADKLNYDEEIQKFCNYEKLEKCIKFFKIINLLETEKKQIDSDSVKKRFEELFSKEYCLTYYLQMLMFIQVDNAGKNAMFDSWGNGLIYPRPYDMDTQVGLDNSGKDIIPVSAELISSERPGDSGINAEINWRYKGEGREVDQNEYRLTSYNTRNSRLWNFIAKYYQKDIQNLYYKLRNNGIYSEDSICSFVNNKTSNIISKTQYNKDAVLKYLLPDRTDYFYVLAGGREDRYRQIIRERLIFLDSVFEYPSTYNKTLYYRADASTPNNIVKLNLSSISPQYVSLISGGSTIKFYVSPDLTYCINPEVTEEEQKIYSEGILLNYINQSTDRETQIFGFNNLKFINGLGNALPRLIQNLSNGIKLNQFDLQQAPAALTEIILSENTMLNKVNISNCPGITSINLLNASYLKEVNINNNTTLNSLTLPKNSPITKLNLTNNPALTSLTLQGLPNLTSENLILPQNLQKLTIIDCPLLNEIDIVSLSKLTDVIINNCDKLISFKGDQLKNLTSITLKNCNNLTEVSLKGTYLQTLYLDEDNNNLETIDLSDSNQLKTLKLPNTNKIKMLNLKNCSKLSTINSDTNGEYNFENVFNTENSSTLCCYNNTALKSIQNLEYKGTGKEIFYMCQNLEKINNSNIIFETSLENAFRQCIRLATIDENTTFSMTDQENYKVKSMRFAFSSASQMPISINNLLEIFVYGNDELTDAGFAFYSCGYKLYSGEEGWVLEEGENYSFPAGITNLESAFYQTNLKAILNTNLFTNCKKVSNLQSIFEHNLLETIPEGIFTNVGIEVNGLILARYVFANNKDLQSCINYELFSDVSTLINHRILVDNFFANCENLTNENNDISNNINKFFINDIVHANESFANTGISFIPDGIFDNIKKLTHIQGLFSYCKNLTQLPNYFVSSNNQKLDANASLDCSGLFYNCTNLEGTISENLFQGLKENITTLGAIARQKNSSESTKSRYLLGAFANTKISSYQSAAFKGMSKLTDISYLFAQANVELVSSGLNNTISDFYITLPEESENKKYFKGYQNLDNKNELGYGMFEKCNSISSVIGAFMGTGIEAMEAYTGNINDYQGFFGLNTPNITDISNLFNNSNILLSDSEEDKYLVSLLLNKMLSIKEAQYAFANNTNILYIGFIKNWDKLENITGVFANCSSIPTEIPIDLFNASQKTLKKIDYAFANTLITNVQEEEPNIFSINNDFTICVYNEGIKLKEFEVNDTKLKDKNTALDINKVSQDSEKNLILYYTNNTQETILFDNIKFQFTIEENPISIRDYHGKMVNFYGSTLEDFNVNILNFSKELPEPDTNGNYLIEFDKNSNINGIFRIQKSIITTPSNSLFYDCTALESVEGLFLNTNLTKIPNYIFTSNKELSALKNISFMFYNCTECRIGKDNDKKEFLDSSWLLKCNNVENITGLFTNLGNNSSNIESKPSLSLGTVFDYLPNITKAGAAFANIPKLLKETTLTNNFMIKSLTNTNSNYGLKDCSNIFALTPLSQINKVFEGSSSSMLQNKINLINNGFAFCINDTNYLSLPTYNKFNIADESIKGCWYSLDTIINQNNNNYWPQQSYIYSSSPDQVIQNIQEQISNYCNNFIGKKSDCYYLTSTTGGTTSSIAESIT